MSKSHSVISVGISFGIKKGQAHVHFSSAVFAPALLTTSLFTTTVLAATVFTTALLPTAAADFAATVLMAASKKPVIPAQAGIQLFWEGEAPAEP